MSFAFGEIRQERHDCYAVFYEGGPGIECRRYDKQFPSFDEAWEWVRAKHHEVMTPKVKKPIEPTYAPGLLNDLAAALPGTPQQPDAKGNLYIPVSAEQWQELTEADLVADLVPADEPDAPEAPKAAETATGDQAASAEAPKRRGRPPKVRA